MKRLQRSSDRWLALVGWVVLGATSLGAQGPTISAFSPETGLPLSSVTVSGDGLQEVLWVTLAGQSVRFSSLGSDKISFVVPADARSGLIEVGTLAGRALSNSPFRVTPPPPPRATEVVPAIAVPGEEVTVHGENLAFAYSVQIGGFEARFSRIGFLVVEIPADVPAGPQSLSITSLGGTDWFPDALTIHRLAPPVVEQFSPTSGSPGTAVRITGANFSGPPQVYFNGLPATLTQSAPDDRNVLIAVVPPKAVTGPVTVEGRGGRHTTEEWFEVDGKPPIVIHRFAPSSGLPGDVVQLEGINLDLAFHVAFGGTDATPGKRAAFSSTPDELLAIVPWHSSGRIFLRTPHGVVATLDPFTFIDFGGLVRVERDSPYPATLGAPFEFRVVVMNQSNEPITGAALTQVLPVGVSPAGETTPPPAEERRFLHSLGTIGPRDRAVVQTAVVGDRPGRFDAVFELSADQLGGKIQTTRIPYFLRFTGPHELMIRELDEGMVEVSWPAETPAQLQRRHSLADPWSTIDAPPAIAFDRFIFATENDVDHQFFRLLIPEGGLP